MSTDARGELAQQAHLYLAAPEDWASHGELARTLRLLTDDERRRYRRYRASAPARAFATGRALARRALSRYADVAPESWLLAPDEHGRPRIRGAAGELDFNLSHNHRLVACLVTAGAAGGVDVEWLDRTVDELRIAEHSFGELETEDLRALAGEARRHRFFAYWTLKEAYLKARGRGIAMRLDSAQFRFSPHGRGRRIEVRFAARTGDRPEDWRLGLYRVAGDQLLAVALRPARGGELALRVFGARPRDLCGHRDDLEPVAASRPAVEARR